ncbi:acyltransferase-domain-containing protein [Amylocarpus encephaloides]|uniref:Acyltransferase-domain-containing protein n=1 Tax=Amylocarpus encephaloides TaxID=45428 RepID=A0A9P7YF87_9HELO|nr:acyltransferase-domain-containing protein [Amylocarpus encephaloides]
MESQTLKQRKKPAGEETRDLGSTEDHPGGHIKHSGGVQLLRLLGAALFFISTCCTIVVTQFVGVPLYCINRNWYYAYMALTKQSFGVAVTFFTHRWAPSVIKISGDASVEGQLRKTPDGRFECNFPERLIMVANHQIYSDWLYLWWVAYTNQPSMHGHIYILLKESLKRIPIIGWGMQFYGFIFMARKMETDRPRMAHRLKVLKEVHSGPMSGTKGLDPMWLLLFPEGTNISRNTLRRSKEFAEKQRLKNTEHTVLPRGTGMYFCLTELDGTVDYVYDCTVAYEGVQRGEFGEEVYTLQSIYLQGRPPPSISMYWRCFAVKDIPIKSQPEFEDWLRDRWHEKDKLMEQYLVTGSFPGFPPAIQNNETNGVRKEAFVESKPRLAFWWEVGYIYLPLATYALLLNLVWKFWLMAAHVRKVTDLGGSTQ